MKIERLETHDRLEKLHKEQALNIFQGAEDCLKHNNLSVKLQHYSPYIYLYAHLRTLDLQERWQLWHSGKYKSWEDVPSHKMIWQPRLTKGRFEPNSYLFRAFSNTDNLETCWLLPPTETWGQYKKGNITEHAIVNWSIDQYKLHKLEIEKPYPDDLNEEQIRNIYLKVASDTDDEIRMDKLYAKNQSSS